jgi:hypothetical protein
MPDWARIAYWVVAGALVFTGTYLTFFGELPPYVLIAGAAMAIGGWFALGPGKFWTLPSASEYAGNCDVRADSRLTSEDAPSTH